MLKRPSFTLGIEEEYQVIDPETRALRSHIERLIDEGRAVLQEKLKPELHQSVVEMGTGICRDIEEARKDVIETRTYLARLARQHGLRIGAAGTHPIAHWADVPTTPDERYNQILHDLQVVARGNLIFGLHVHVGVEDREAAVQIMNEVRYLLPHVLALSTNSPFWVGRETGWMSYRCKVWDKFPRTNIPDFFGSHGEYAQFVDLLLETRCIADRRQIWWDVRPHPVYPTLEYRICDIPMRADETIAIAALFQAITAKLWKLHSMNQGFRQYRRALIMENKQRAARWGTTGKLIDFGKREEVSTRDLIEELLDFVDDVVDELGSREEVTRVRDILRMGTGAERQLDVWKRTGDLNSVVDLILDETEHGLDVG